MSTILFATAAVAALTCKVAAFPLFYNDNFDGCEIPTMGLGLHGDPEASALVTITVTDGTAEVTEYIPSGEHMIEIPPYTGDASNCWIHASAGTIEPVDAETHAQATACTEGGYSTGPAPNHVFKWTAPASGPVTISVAQAVGATDAYKTATMDLEADGDEAEGPEADAEDDPEADAEDDPEADADVEDDGAADDEVDGGGEAEEEEVSGAGAVVTGVLAAAAAAAAALAL